MIGLPISLFSQDFIIKGYVMDEENNPLPGVNVFVKEGDFGVTTDNEGRYQLELIRGYYDIVFSMVGYKTEEAPIFLEENEVIKNVYLKEDLVTMEEVLVQNKRRDASYGYIKNAIKSRNKYRNQPGAVSMDVYVKAFDRVNYKMSKKDSIYYDTLSVDSLKPDTAKKILNMSYLESFSRVHFEVPNHYKEERNAVKKYGNIERLFYTRPSENVFNFYDGLITNDITESLLISPLNPSSFVNYKFKLLGSYMHNERLIHKIKVTPRGHSNATFSGEIEIVDKLWRIKRLKLSVNKQVLIPFDALTIHQEYEEINDSLWLMNKQRFTYHEKYGKERHKGSTLVKYSNFDLQPNFKKRYFSNALRITKQEAYEKDSSFWNINRPDALSKKEIQFMNFHDSIKVLRQKDSYLDSLDENYNKISLWNILYEGQHKVNSKKRYRMYFGSLWDVIQPFAVGGFRTQYWFDYYKRTKDRKNYFFAISPSYGIRNKDIRGTAQFQSLYNPKKRAWYFLRTGRDVEFINPWDAFINRFRRDNYYEKDFLEGWHSTELFNGFYFRTGLFYANRRSIDKFQFGEITDQVFENNHAVSFEGYQAFEYSIRFIYYFNQKFLIEPYEKVILGSKFPYVVVYYRKGLPGFLSSDVNFDELEFSLNQTFKIGVMGTSTYRIASGKFFNTNNLRFIDYRYHQSGDPLLFTNPMFTYQTLDNTFPSEDWYLDIHYVYHFNGALTKKIPFLNKLGVKSVAGFAYLHTLTPNVQHIEGHFGVEKMIKVFKHRFRIGTYYAVGSTDYEKPRSELKISIEHYDRKARKWSF